MLVRHCGHAPPVTAPIATVCTHVHGLIMAPLVGAATGEKSEEEYDSAAWKIRVSAASDVLKEAALMVLLSHAGRNGVSEHLAGDDERLRRELERATFLHWTVTPSAVIASRY